MQTATFAAGCFWGVELEFSAVSGVVETAVGYMGGHTEAPTYEDVCSGSTGHAEVVQLRFDPDQVTYDQLLDLFWRLHDPTTPNRQGPDVGSQYRSAIFTHTPAQAKAAASSRAALDGSGRLPRPVVTEIASAGPFTRAEQYHQKYLARRGRVACRTQS